MRQLTMTVHDEVLSTLVAAMRITAEQSGGGGAPSEAVDALAAAMVESVGNALRHAGAAATIGRQDDCGGQR